MAPGGCCEWAVLVGGVAVWGKPERGASVYLFVGAGLFLSFSFPSFLSGDGRGGCCFHDLHVLLLLVTGARFCHAFFFFFALLIHHFAFAKELARPTLAIYLSLRPKFCFLPLLASILFPPLFFLFFLLCFSLHIILSLLLHLCFIDRDTTLSKNDMEWVALHSMHSHFCTLRASVLSY